MLLILDNLETLAPERTRELAQALAGLDPRNGSRVLMTLRPLDHDPLTGLADRRDRHDLATLGRADALRLAWDEAQRQDLPLTPHSYGRPLTPDQAAELAALRQAAGLPGTLARVEVAALDELAELAFRHPALIKRAVLIAADEDLEEARRTLQRLRGHAIEQVLEELIGRMLDALLARAPEALAVLHAALAFVGGAEERRLRAVATGHPADADEDAALDFRDGVLRPAERANLLNCEGRRYDLEPPVRAYLERRRPPEPGDRRAYELRHAEAHLPIVADYDTAIREGRMTYSAPLEWSNVAAALDWLKGQATGDDDAARLLVRYAQRWRNVLFNNYDPRRLAWLEAARGAAERVGSPWEQANVLQALGDVQQFRDDRDAALSHYQEALALFRAVGSKLGEANVLQALGDVQQFRKDMDAALSHYQEALALFRAVGDRLGEANVLVEQSRLALIAGDQPEAERLFAQANDIFRVIGTRYGVARSAANYGLTLRDLGRHQEARAYFQQAADLLGELGMEEWEREYRQLAEEQA